MTKEELATRYTNENFDVLILSTRKGVFATKRIDHTWDTPKFPSGITVERVEKERE